MKMRFVLIGLLAAGFAAPGQAFDFDDYSHAVAQRCPAKHLDELPPGELADRLDFFVGSLPAAERDHLLKEADIERTCADVEAGASCQNFAQIEAAHKLKLLPRLIDSLCEPQR